MNNTSHAPQGWAWLAATALLAASGSAWSASEASPPVAAHSTNVTKPAATGQAAPRLARPDFNSFSNIAALNIFNAWRTPGGGQTPPGERRPEPPPQDRFALIGTMTYTKGGTMAFFDGTTSDYKKVLKNEAMIGKFKITEITHRGVKLEADGKQYELKVGMQLSRPPGGEWEVSVRTDSVFASMDSSSGSEASEFSQRGSRNMRENGGGGRRQRGGDFGASVGGFASPTGVSPVSSSPTPSTTAEVDDILKKLMEAREKETK